jgi:hypothetical protein
VTAGTGADDMAAMSMNEDSMVLDMNPGFNITVKVPFDVPPGTVAEKIERNVGHPDEGQMVTLGTRSPRGPQRPDHASTPVLSPAPPAPDPAPLRPIADDA